MRKADYDIREWKSPIRGTPLTRQLECKNNPRCPDVDNGCVRCARRKDLYAVMGKFEGKEREVAWNLLAGLDTIWVDKHNKRIGVGVDRAEDLAYVDILPVESKGKSIVAEDDTMNNVILNSWEDVNSWILLRPPLNLERTL
jgi:hypothetical protein